MSDEERRESTEHGGPPAARVAPARGGATSGGGERSGVVVLDEARPDGSRVTSGRDEAPSAGESVREASPHDDLPPPEALPDAGPPADLGAKDGSPATSKDAETSAKGDESPDDAAASRRDGDAAESSRQPGRTALFVGGGLLTVVVLFALFVPKPTTNQWLVFGMLAALGGSCVATVLSGFLEFDHKGVKAGGTLAVFVFVFYAFYRHSPEGENMMPTEAVAVAAVDVPVAQREALERWSKGKSDEVETTPETTPPKPDTTKEHGEELSGEGESDGESDGDGEDLDLAVAPIDDEGDEGGLGGAPP